MRDRKGRLRRGRNFWCYHQHEPEVSPVLLVITARVRSRTLERVPSVRWRTSSNLGGFDVPSYNHGLAQIGVSSNDIILASVSLENRQRSSILLCYQACLASRANIIKEARYLRHAER